MTREQKVERMLAVIDYRLGDYYMGGMMQARLSAILNGTMWDPLRDLIKVASETKLDKCLEESKSYLEFMDANPVKKCPCCGTVVRADRIKE